jgi:hypothetical protein
LGQRNLPVIKDVNVVSRQKSFVRSDLARPFISIVLGILATISGLVTLSSLFLNPMNMAGGITPEIQGRLFRVFLGMIAGFVFGMLSWLVGNDAFLCNKGRPHWKISNVCGSLGIAFGILAMLVYLVFISFLPVLLPLQK